MRVLLGDGQVDLPHVHQFGPALHCGCADVWDDTGQSRVLIRGQDNHHADGVAMVGELDDPIPLPLWCGGQALAEERFIYI